MSGFGETLRSVGLHFFSILTLLCMLLCISLLPQDWLITFALTSWCAGLPNKFLTECTVPLKVSMIIHFFSLYFVLIVFIHSFIFPLPVSTLHVI